LAIIAYCMGLIAVEIPSALSVADKIGIVSHDAINRALSAIGDDLGKIIMFIIQLLKPQTAISGCLIIDDVIIRKPYGPKLPYISKIYDHTTGTYVKGYQVVVLLWSNGLVKIPLAWRLWRPKEDTKPYKTKLQLAMDMLDSPVVRLLPVSFVTFDIWYASVELLKFLDAHHLHFVTMVKKNRKFKLTGSNSPIRADELAQSFRHDQYRYYPSVGFYIRSMILELTNYGNVRLSIVKNGRRAAINDTRFIITDMLDLTAAGVVQNYLMRWNIEVFFRDIKQHLGFEKCRMRDYIKLQGHLTLVFISYMFVEYMRIAHKFETIGDTVNYLKSASTIEVGDKVFTVYTSLSKGEFMQKL
jgi:Transposase DDE domain.